MLALPRPPPFRNFFNHSLQSTKKRPHGETFELLGNDNRKIKLPSSLAESSVTDEPIALPQKKKARSASPGSPTSVAIPPPKHSVALHPPKPLEQPCSWTPEEYAAIVDICDYDDDPVDVAIHRLSFKDIPLTCDREPPSLKKNGSKKRPGKIKFMMREVMTMDFTGNGPISSYKSVDAVTTWYVPNRSDYVEQGCSRDIWYTKDEIDEMMINKLVQEDDDGDEDEGKAIDDANDEEDKFSSKTSDDFDNILNEILGGETMSATNADKNDKGSPPSYSRDIYRAAFLAGYNHFQRLSIECKEPISWFWKGQIRVENETITSLLQEDNNGADHSTTSNVTEGMANAGDTEGMTSAGDTKGQQ